MRRVACSVTFFYDEESWRFPEFDDRPLTDEEILNRCQVMFIEDITDINEPFPVNAVKAEFMEEN